MSNASDHPSESQTVQDRLASLRQLAQAFPKEQREDVLLELDDLSTDLANTDGPSLQTLQQRLKRLAAIAMMARMFATSNQQAIEEFASNLVELTQATKIEVE
ncbi:hypothetical protein N836_17240 [Leptolyngbya sp. Heron Island J]|uniref:hypothetical protein n=1 Tax=Leptolyngbya sp. Heron Island J TaxID=1385935 RepID=UPI0003B99C33|nr:hypothetical protein [Leptolyngbya sp. Heron Island J]ESA34369.1 hypothetical protein N836_17240 [Leptolyngbya sp. Heron Island J]